MRAIPVWLEHCTLLSICEGVMEVVLQASAGRSGLEPLGSRPVHTDLAAEVTAEGKHMSERNGMHEKAD